MDVEDQHARRMRHQIAPLASAGGLSAETVVATLKSSAPSALVRMKNILRCAPRPRSLTVGAVARCDGRAIATASISQNFRGPVVVRIDDDVLFAVCVLADADEEARVLSS